VLMIASRRKAENLRTQMRSRGLDESRLARLQAPAGPSVGAKTPGEIAMVAIVGVLAALRGRDDQAVASERTQPRAAPATFVNPVCGIAVSIASPKHVEVYAGVSYYFCCDGCRTTFLRDPGKYSAIYLASVSASPA
jgi:xanthine dehydrogenase accessory factor